jgi:hypothetical protein
MLKKTKTKNVVCGALRKEKIFLRFVRVDDVYRD